MPNSTPNELVKKVEEFIRNSPHGVSIQDVAKQFSMTRYSANGILGQLIGAEKVGVNQIGPVKVHFWKETKSKGGE